MQQFGYRWKLTITKCSLTTTRTATSRRKELYNWYYVFVVKTHDTNDNVTTKTQSIFHTKYMNIDTWSEGARSSLVCFVSQVLVVMICSPRRGSSLSCARHLMAFIFNLLHYLLHFFHYLEGSSNTATSWRLMWSPSQSPWPTHSSPSKGS